MDTQKQIIERLKQANNVLVTVSNNPSVDQLSALLGLGLALTKLDKHASAVYSGETPSTIDFLQPDETLEKNTDSLRDFIISLDKSKADKLRYKVEDSVVRIFITPYRTSISDSDLEFSQGDFNVDVVVALGVHEQQDLDQAITAHGRILHDAAVITINTDSVADLGSINWLNDSASSISEMVTALVNGLGKDVLDEQISTALLTGIVAETDRFSNEKTSATTMKASAVLMAAGANQQLVATKLEEAQLPPEPPEDEIFQEAESEPEAEEVEQVDEPEPISHAEDDGTLQIVHDDPEPASENGSDDELAPELPQPVGDFEEPEHNWPSVADEPEEPEISAPEPESRQPDEPEQPPTPGLTITPQVSHEEIDDLLLPPEEPKELPKISKAFASGESALYEPKITPDHPKNHQLMTDGPTFDSYDTNVDTEAEDAYSDSLNLPDIDGNSHDDDEDDDTPVNHNSFVLGSHKDAPPTEDKIEEKHPKPPITVVPPPSDLDDDVKKPELPAKHAEPAARPQHLHTEPESTHFVPKPNETLSEIEQEINSPYAHLSPYDELDIQTLKHPIEPEKPAVTLDTARDAVAQAMSVSEPVRPEPIIALNAQPLGAPLHEAPQPDAIPQFVPQFNATPAPVERPTSTPPPIPMPQSPVPQPVSPTPAPVMSTNVPFDLPAPASQPAPSFSQQTAPVSTAPPVPPPIMPPFPGQ